MSRVGPKLALRASCAGCDYLRGSNRGPGRNPATVTRCASPTHSADVMALGGRRIGGLITPDWCPYLPGALAKFLPAERGRP